MTNNVQLRPIPVSLEEPAPSIEITTPEGKRGQILGDECAAFYNLMMLRDHTKPFMYDGHQIHMWKWSDQENWKEPL